MGWDKRAVRESFTRGSEINMVMVLTLVANKDTLLALEMSRLVHSECKDVPHDIGLRLLEIVEQYRRK